MSIEFRPPTGVGRFKAKRQGLNLEIKHRLAVLADVVSPPSATDFALWQTTFQQLITNHWEGKYELQRNGVTAQIIFRLKFLGVPEYNRAHFVVNVKESLNGPSENVGRDAHHKYKAGGDNAPRSASFYTKSILQPNSVSLIAADLPNILPYYADFTGTNMSPQTTSQIKSMMSLVARLNPQPRLYVTGYGNSADTNKRAVMALMTQCGLTRVHARNSKKFILPTNWGNASHSKMSGGVDYVKISTSRNLNTASMLTQSAVFSYPATVVHEYGHMLGLQDEYHCLSNQASGEMVTLNMIDASEQQKYEDFHFKGANVPSPTVSTGQVEFIRACNAAGIEAPHFGRQTSSVMASGSDFLAAHYIWPLQAMKQLTGQNDWTLVKI